MSYSCKNKKGYDILTWPEEYHILFIYKDANVTEKKRSVFGVNVYTKSPILFEPGIYISVISSAQEQVFLLSDHKLLKVRNTG